jgi:DNA primase
VRVASVVRQIAEEHLSRYREGADHEIIGLCPLHEDNTPSFAINEKTGLWVCYGGCGGGSLSYLLYRLEYGRKKIDHVLGPIRDQLQLPVKKRIKDVADPFRALYPLPEALLGVYDVDKPHPMLADIFEPELLRRYDVGYDRRNHRITFPIRDLYGNLAGFSGRATARTPPNSSGDIAKYKIYDKEIIKEYPDYKFDRSRHLYNMDRVYPNLYYSEEVQPLILVEGFKAALWLIQCGFPNVVAFMGAALTTSGCALIQRLSSRIILFLDNDVTGRRKTAKVGRDLSRAVRRLSVVEYPFSAFAQPDSFDDDELTLLFNDHCLPLRRWVRRHTT